MAVRGKRAPGVGDRGSGGGQTGPVIEVSPSAPGGGVGGGENDRQPLEMPNVSGIPSEFPEESHQEMGTLTTGAMMEQMKERLQEGTGKAGDGESRQATQEKFDPKEPFPPPPSAYIIDRPERFFAYWRSLDQRFLDRAVVYVYRTHPVINKLICPQCKALQEPKKGTAPYRCPKCSWTGNLSKYIDKLAQPISADAVLGNYGCGQYEFTLIDSMRSVTVLKARVTTVTDYNAYPPMMEDYAHVDVYAPTNKSYVQWAKMKGIKFPQLADTDEKEEQEMAKLQTEMITPLTQTIERMTDKMMEDRTRRDTTPPTPKSTDEAISAGIRLVADASAKSQEIIAKSYEQASGLGKDPMDNVKGLLGVLKDSGLIGRQQQSSGTEMIQQLVPLLDGMMNREATMMKAQLELNMATINRLHEKTQSLETRVFDLLAKERNAATPPSITEKLEELEKLKKLFNSGGSRGDESEDKPVWEKLLEKVAPLVIMSLPVIMARMTGAPVGVPGAGGMSGTPGAPGLAPNQGDTAQTLYQTQQNPINTQSQPMQGEDPAMFDLQQQFLTTFRDLEPRIVEELKKEYPDGISFARGFKQFVPMGAVKHAMLKAQVGADTIKGALEMYGSDELKTIISMDRQRFDRFLYEFLNPEEAEEQYAQAEEEELAKGDSGDIFGSTPPVIKPS